MTHIKPLSAELQKIANEEFNEVPSRISKDLHKLKLRIQRQPHLKARLDDQFLVQFLRFCQYNLDQAAEKLDYFYTFKSLYPDISNAVDVDSVKFRRIHNMGCMAVLPTPLNDCGPRIVVYRYLYPPEKYAIEEIIEICFATVESLIMTDPYACICGIVYILDMSQITVDHLRQYTAHMVKKIVAFYEKCIPLRTKSFCYINVPSCAEEFFKLFLCSLSAELREKVLICGKNMSELAEKIPLKYLPHDFGGENGCLQDLVDGYNNVWDGLRDYFKQNAQYGTDENLRCGKSLDFNGILDNGLRDSRLSI